MDVSRCRGTSWSVTCNLKEIKRSTVDTHIENARSLGWGIEGQLEKGKEGTEHYQLLVKTPQVRFSAVKRVFPTAHIELARNVAALQNYVHKEDTRLETIKKVEVSFVTYPQVRNKFFEWVVEVHDIMALSYDEEKRLRLWDEFIGLSIEEGIDADIIGVNPQNRSCIMRYWNSFVRRQIDKRQTNISVDNRQSDSQEVSLPMYT